MTSDLAIRVDGLSKCYLIYDKPQDRLKQLLWRGRRQFYSEFWALRDVSFEVRKGETVGIIGRNGSGKSTLLQLICGTLSPTNGDTQVNGRIAALLELGAGFNPEFTGRENVYMNASILGLSTVEIDAQYPNIVAFADIGDFINQPVKTYSSGMYIRLAFAVAINVNADILIVDEALAVGDMLFQAKCMIKMKEMMNSGVTVLFVSHDTATIKGLCQRCVYLNKGRMIEFGRTANVVGRYISDAHLSMNQLLENSVNTHQNISLKNEESISESTDNEDLGNIEVSTHAEASWADSTHRYGDGGARILDIKLLDDSRNPVSQLEVGQKFTIQASVRFDKSMPTFALGYSIRDLKGQMLVGGVTSGERIQIPSVNKGETYIVEISSVNSITAGIYTISLGLELPIVLNQQHIFIDIIEHAIVFESKFHPDPVNLFHVMVKIPSEYAFFKIS